MANLIATTPWKQTKTGSTTGFAVTLTQAATAGSVLVLSAFGGAQVTAKITNSSGAAWSMRSQALGTMAASISDFTAVGGETTVWVVLNGAENVAGIIYELGSLGAFIAATNNGSGALPANANDYQAKPSSAVTVASGSAVLVGGWGVIGTFASVPSSLTNQWRQMGPLGKIYVNDALQPGANTQFLYASGLADVTAAASYPVSLSAGQYEATSVWAPGGSNNGFAVQAAYADTSGLATVPAPSNPIAAENSLPGTFNTNWFDGAFNAGVDSTIAGYCDKTSYLPGDTVNFKVDSTSNPFRVEIYRLGWYGWDSFGARLMTGNGGGYITGTTTAQSAASVDGTLGSSSCAWTTNATWAIPSGAAPGVYYVLFRRTDVTTHIATGHFIVRSASAAGKVAVVLPDFTYQAYNLWGATTDVGLPASTTYTGRSLYALGSEAANFAHRAYAVSFDRPTATQQNQYNTYIFDAEQATITFLEAQGYNLTYYSLKDLDDNTTLLSTASLVALIGHHEYWTAGVYDCLTHAADAGVNFMICSSDTAGWHTRFAAGDTAKRTMICYKDSGTQDVSAGFTGTGVDPVSYTGTWRDSRTSTPNNTDIRRENALTGQIFAASVSAAATGQAITVPFASKTLPIWRNSASVQALTTGQTYTQPVAMTGHVGTEYDAPDGSAGQPVNLVNLCPTALSTTAGANANGTIYSSTVTPTTGWTLYRRESGALVFNTGNWRGLQGISRWAQQSLGGTIVTADLNWQNALLAILYDLGARSAQVTSLRPGTAAALTDPATGAPAGGRNAVAVAYGLTLPGGHFL
jgi:hypothetical protein